MKSFCRALSLFPLLAVFTLTACGGGGSDGGVTGGGSNLLAASFTPDQANPGTNSVTLQEGATSANQVTILVRVTETVDLTGGSFDLFYDPARFTYTGYRAGNLFESSGVTPLYGVNEPVSGHLVIGVGGASAASVSGSETLIALMFRADVRGSGQVSIDLADLQDASGQSVSGVTWEGGTLIGS